MTGRNPISAESLRESFEAKANELSIALDKLRSGTGPGVAVLVMQGWDEGYAAGAAAMKEKAAQTVEDDDFWGLRGDGLVDKLAAAVRSLEVT